MSVNGPPLADTPGLTERQKKWFASVRASLERDTGKSLEAWVAIARTCPQTGPRARAQWLKETYGLGVNRAAQIFSAAFPEPDGWDQPDTLREARWSDPSSRAILGALEAATMALPEVVCGQRKQFTSFSRKVQFASLRRHLDGVRTSARVRRAVTADVRRAARLLERGLATLA